MTLVTELELPDFDLSDPDLVGETYHDRLAALRQEGWLARSPIAIVVLERAAGEFFLRARTTAFYLEPFAAAVSSLGVGAIAASRLSR